MTQTKIKECLRDRDGQGRAPLFLAAANGHNKCVRILLGAGAAVHTRCYKGNTPLHAAARANKTHTVKLLLRNGANLNARNEKGKFPFQLTTSKLIKSRLQLEQLRPATKTPPAKKPAAQKALALKKNTATKKPATKKLVVFDDYESSKPLNQKYEVPANKVVRNIEGSDQDPNKRTRGSCIKLLRKVCGYAEYWINHEPCCIIEPDGKRCRRIEKASVEREKEGRDPVSAHGAHVKFGGDPSLYLVATCPHHNTSRKTCSFRCAPGTPAVRIYRMRKK